MGLGIFLGTGEAPVDEIPTELEEGAVILAVERVSDAPGSALKVSWELNPEYSSPTDTVDIFFVIGEYGSDFTLKVIEDDVLAATAPTGVSLGTKSFEWPGQVGAGHPEIYFKGCLTGMADESGPTGLAGNIAVGKYNALVAAPVGPKTYKYSFVSVPFFSSDPSADAVFGEQLFGADSKANATELWGWTGTTFGDQMYLKSGTGWLPIGAFTPINVSLGSGYVFKTKQSATEDRQLTLIGKVINVAFEPISLGANLYSFIGNPYPKYFSLSDANLTSASGVFGGEGSGYADQLWGWTGDTFGEQVYFNSTDSNWQAIGSFTALTGLAPARTFVYRRNSGAPTGGFDWGFGP
jgi:hypothetical protein